MRIVSRRLCWGQEIIASTQAWPTTNKEVWVGEKHSLSITCLCRQTKQTKVTDKTFLDGKNSKCRQISQLAQQTHWETVLCFGVKKTVMSFGKLHQFAKLNHSLTVLLVCGRLSNCSTGHRPTKVTIIAHLLPFNTYLFTKVPTTSFLSFFLIGKFVLPVLCYVEVSLLSYCHLSSICCDHLGDAKIITSCT